MVLPNLLHPVLVKIEQIDKTNTVYDSKAREPIQQANRKVFVTIPGQVNWVRTESIQAQKGGIRETAQGYILFRKVDLDALNVVLDYGDRILKIGHLDVELYVSDQEWQGHYADQNGGSLLRAYFQDRKPGKRIGNF